MSEGKRTPPSRYVQWSRRIFTANREESSHARRADSEEASSPRPLIQLGATDGGPGASARNTSHRSRQAVPQPRSYAPLLGDAHSQQSLWKRHEKGDEDLGCFDTVSPTTGAFREPPASMRGLTGFGDDMGDSQCFVAMSSKQRRPKSSLVLQARGDDETLDRQTEGGSQVGADNLRSESRLLPSVSVSVHRQIQRVKRQHTASTQPATVPSPQKPAPLPRGGHGIDDASFNVTSTSTRKPTADLMGQAAPRSKKQGMTIEISFTRSAAVDNEGKLLKSISTKVESIVARVLQRHGEDGQPVSRYDSEGAVAELDSEARISVTLNDARRRQEQKESMAAGAPVSKPSSPIQVTVETKKSTSMSPQGVPRTEGTRKYEEERPPFVKAEETPTPVRQPLAIEPSRKRSPEKLVPAQPASDRVAKPGKKTTDITAVLRDPSSKDDIMDIAQKTPLSAIGAPEQSKIAVEKPVPEIPEKKSEAESGLENSTLKSEKRKSIQQEGRDAKKSPSATGAPEASKIAVEKPVPETPEKIEAQSGLEKSMLKSEKRKSIQQEGSKAKKSKKARKASKTSSETGQPIPSRKQSLMTKKQYPPVEPPNDGHKEADGAPEQARLASEAPSAAPATGKDNAAVAVVKTTEQVTKATTEANISTQKPAEKGAEVTKESENIASGAATVKETYKEPTELQETKDRETLQHPERKQDGASPKLIEPSGQMDRKDIKRGLEEVPHHKDKKEEDTKTTSVHSILKRPKKRKSKKGDKTSKEKIVGMEEKKPLSSPGPVLEEKEHAEQKASPDTAGLKAVHPETGEKISKQAKRKKSSKKIPGHPSIGSDVGPQHERSGHEIGAPGRDLDDFLVGFERALSPYLTLVGVESPESEAKREKKGKKGGRGKRRSIVRMSQIDVDRKRGKKGQSGETSPVSPYAGSPAAKDEHRPGLYVGEEEEKESKRRKKEKKKKKEKKEKRKKKRSKRKGKRDEPIDYRSGKAPCRIVCPFLIGLLLAGLLVFIILKLLGPTTTTTSLPTTTTAFTRTRGPPKPRPPPPPHPTPSTSGPKSPSIGTTTSGLPPASTVSTPPGLSPSTVTLPPTTGVYVCESEPCKREGAYIATLLSNSKPCENFYGYVCDAWSQQNPPGPDGIGSIVSRDTIIQDTLAQELLAVIKSAPEEDLKIAAALHASCAARPAPDSNVKFIREMFSKWAIKDWPFHSTNVNAEVLWKFAGELMRDLGISALFTLTVGVNPTGAPKAVVELGCPRFLLDSSEKLFDKVQEMFKGAVDEALKLFPGDNHDIPNEIKNVFDDLGRRSEAGRCNSSASHEEWTYVRYSVLDGGVKEAIHTVLGSKEEPPVVLKSAMYIRNELVSFIKDHPSDQVLNYMGFLVLVRLAPFLPEGMRYLRSLFVRSMLWRTVPDVADSSTLCLLAVESLLPNCFSKASAILGKKKDTGFGTRDVLSRLETIFGAEIKHLAWVGELSALFIRYAMQRRPVIQFGPRSGSCASEEGVDKSVPLKHYYQVSMLQQQQKLQALLNDTAAANVRAFESELDTVPRYDPTRRSIHVPAAIINASVRTNQSLFAFHLSRVATRLYKPMTKLLTEDAYGPIPLPDITESSRQRLGTLLECIGNDSSVGKAKRLHRAVLEQAVAIHLAFRAFHELLHVRRIWGLDYRLAGLPDTSADQLFFIYLALDNCDAADAVYRKKQPEETSGNYMINIPLQHVQQFAEAFHCEKQHGCKIVG